MDERLVSELEAAIADSGALLVRLQKYRRGVGPEGTALLGEAMALGDAARRLHHRAALDEEAAGGLLTDARALASRMRAFLASVRSDAAYRDAVAAHAAGAQAVLERTLPGIFAGLARVLPPTALFHPVTWRRRGRPRPATDLAADACALVANGIPAEGDDLSPGVDPELPAVTLHGEAPADEPVVLRIAGAALGASIFRLEDTGEYLIYTPELRTPACVLVAPRLDAEDVEDAPVDYAGYRDEIRAALAAAGVPLV